MKTLPYPGFPTDLQPQLMSLLTTCSGQSVLEETVFEGRMRQGMHCVLVPGRALRTLLNLPRNCFVFLFFAPLSFALFGRVLC